MDARSIHLQDLGMAVNYLNGVIADVGNDQAHWVPAGTVQTIAATYAHVAASTDAQYHRLFQGIPALAETEWAGKTGITPWQPTITLEWGKSVRVDLAQLKAYWDAVSAGLIAFVSSANLEQTIDMSAIGAGSQSLSWCLSQVVSAHLNVLVGEIAILKGLQGMKGDLF